MFLPLMLATMLVSADEVAIRARIHERLTHLDRIAMDVTHTIYGTPDDQSPFDRSAWVDYGLTYEYKLTFVRPDFLANFLHDDPEAGFEPADDAASDAGMTTRSVRPDPLGRATYFIYEESLGHSPFNWNPMFQVFDLHIFQSPIPRLTLERLITEHDAGLTESNGGVHRFHAIVDSTMVVFEFVIDVNERGTPIHALTLEHFKLAERPLPVTIEQFNLAFAEVNGEQLPTESVVIGIYPHIVTQPNIHHIVVTNIQSEGVEPADARIEPLRRNSVITRYRADGVRERSIYDDEGNETVIEMAAAGVPSTGASRGWMAMVVAATGAGAVIALLMGQRRH